MAQPPADESRSSLLPIVGVGASAGGLEAFLEFFKALHPPVGMSFVLVTHLDPLHESQLAEIVGGVTSLKVVQAKDGAGVEPEHVYILPPDFEIEITGGVLHLFARSQSLYPHYPIDHFFASLAADQGRSAVGMIMSGTGSDGAGGIRAIKSGGGTTFCQDSESARFTGMPQAASATGAVDFVMPPAAIAKKLQSLAFEPYLATQPVPPEDEQESGSPDRQISYGRILSLIRNAHSVDFGHYKRNTISRRIGRRMLIRHLGSLADYAKFLENNPIETDELFRDLLISVTSFFREPAMFESVRVQISKSIDTRKSGDTFRVWVAGCATGEEAYSFAIVLAEAFETATRRIPIQIFGTDLSELAVDRARRGLYAANIQQEVSAERLRRFFVQVDSGYRIAESIRQNCVFARHDLTADPPFSQMDLIACRNVLIYLETSIQDRILRSMHYGLKPSGMLILGSAENLGIRSDLFAQIDKENRIFLKKAASAHLNLENVLYEGTFPPLPQVGLPAVTAVQSTVDLEARAARILRDLYAPSGVIVNDDMRVLHFHGPTSYYLEPAQGEASLNLLRLARPPLVYPLREATDKARATNAPVVEPSVRVEHEGQTREITLRVTPLGGETRSYLVLFEEHQKNGAIVPPVANPPSAAAPEPAASDLQLAQATREISHMREYLRKVTEQYEVATEELRAANEEARSANEELQSTNEELRTAKEELQSSNEELITVNEELKHRNDELRIANNDLVNVLSAATIPILIAGMDLRLRRFTPAAERLLGLSASDIGEPIEKVQHAFYVENLVEKIHLAVQQLAIQHARIQDRRGRWYEVYVRPYRTEDDRIEGAVIAFIDVDDLVRALETAENARIFAEGIVDAVQHPLIVLDAGLHIIRATDAFYRMFQVSREETEGQLLTQIGTGQWNFSELRNLLDVALIRDVPFRDLEVECEFPQLGRRTMRLNARRITTNNQPHRLLLAIEDVTDRKETAELQYRRLFESARDAILILDADSGTVIDSNPFFSELTRFQRSEVIGKRFVDLEVFLQMEEARRLVAATVAYGSSRFDTVHVRARDGKMLILTLIANQYRLKEQTFIQVNIRDVTERTRTDERLRRSNLDLQQFAFAASHDLQEPLRTVSSFAQLLRHEQQGRLGEQADKYLQFIVGGADRISQMVLDLLAYSQTVRADARSAPVSVEAVLSSVLVNLQLAIRDSQARITFDYLPTVKMDQTMLMQLLQNLIGNSIKYRSAAPPEIHLSAHEAGPEWIFSVRDNGVGLDTRYAEQIFTVFKRLHGRDYPGTGIGLAICKSVVERHGGRIWVESEPGKGAAFFFTVPKDNPAYA